MQPPQLLQAPQLQETVHDKRLLVECLKPDNWDSSIANHHYSLGKIASVLSLITDCRGSLRGTALASGLMDRLLDRPAEVPSPSSVRSWLLRVGLFQLQKPLEQADDWVWIVDHTVQIGELKCMLVVGLRLSVWQHQEDRTLGYKDVELIALWPVRTSTGKIVNDQLQSAIGRTGLPRLIISDDGRDLHRGLALFQEKHGEVDWIYDIKHKTASLLKAELETDSVWTAFAKQANQTKRHVHQTELAFCNPPQQRGKARYMNVDTLVAWGLKVLNWLDNPQPTGRDLDADRIETKLGWLSQYRKSLRSWQEAMQVIETAETLVRRQGYHARSMAEFLERMPSVPADSLADRLHRKLLDFVKEQVLLVRDRERLPGSSEVLESIIGKYKTLQGERGQFGATGMLLSIGAFVGHLTTHVIQTALETISGAALRQWEQINLGATIQSQRKRAFSTYNTGTKTGSKQLLLTRQN